MKVIAVATEDFATYYELVRALRAQKRPFLSLLPSDRMPSNVGVVITTAAEEARIDFRPKVVVPGPDERSVRMTVRLAAEYLTGRMEYSHLVFGVDPGKVTGLAVLGDGAVILAAEVHSPRELQEEVRSVLRTHRAREVRFRVGRGDPPNRNRMVNALLELGYPVEMADERSTSRDTLTPHADAAADIAHSSGPLVRKRMETVPKPGEVSEVKRLSRLESDNAVTISDRLAEKVLRGELTLEEAIRRQRSRNKKA